MNANLEVLVLRLSTLPQARPSEIDAGDRYPHSESGVSQSMTRTLVSIVACTVLGSVAACGSTSSQASGEFGIGDSDNGQTVQVHVGDVIQVSLASTAWTFSTPSDSSVVGLVADPVVSPAPLGTCVPGMSCGSVIARFKALKAGQVTLSATRLSCGEARRCVGGEGSYQVRVVVS